jgi:hypothetical protein
MDGVPFFFFASAVRRLIIWLPRFRLACTCSLCLVCGIEYVKIPQRQEDLGYVCSAEER